ncbi:MAG: efflux RND transporter permease subunit [Prolixibacteraceae bacterium]|nr:efflux RND transporter permease subunit [Prolixibacteraceae bacterium]
MSELAEIEYTKGPAKISRDNTRRRVVVSVNVRNSDLQTVVDAIRPILDDNLDLPAGYYIEYGGQFQNLNNATNRLKLAVPIALLLIFIFLHFAFGSLRETIMVFSAVPLSVVGGVILLWIRGMPFSISAGVGFIALFGIAVLNGIVLIEHLKELKKEGVTDMKELIIRGTKERLRPVLNNAVSIEKAVEIARNNNMGVKAYQSYYQSQKTRAKSVVDIDVCHYRRKQFLKKRADITF